MLLLFQVMLFNIPKSIAQVLINEIMAINTTTILNSESKNFDDWIELYNTGEDAVVIGDWFLSDNKSKPKKWKIPSLSVIGPKRFKLIWLGKKNTSDYRNFMLNGKGETIYLFDEKLKLVDSVAYPTQEADISYGRLAKRLGEMVYFFDPTPLKQNLSGSKELLFSEEPSFSTKSGFYKEALKVELSTSSGKGKIFYTLDGSEPDQTSMPYTEPVEIGKTTVLRARALIENKLASKVVTQTYFINEISNLPIISLSTEPQYLWGDKIGIYVEGVNYEKDVWESANYFQDWERPVHLEYFDKLGQMGFSMNAGMRIHGRSSRNHDQKTLAIFARGKYGSSSFPYKLFGENSPEKIKSFLLRSGGNDWGITMLLDGFIHTLVNGVIDIDAQLYQPAIVYLNGEYWGIHNIREKINEHYLKNKYKVDPDEIDIIEANDIYASEMVAPYGNVNEYKQLLEFIDNNAPSLQENFEKIKQQVDINEFIDYIATQVYICNFDWPSSNQKLWKERIPEGKWRWILYDTDLSFKDKGKLYFNYLEHMLAKDSSKYTTVPWSNFLIRKLFENEELKFEFIQRTAVYLNTVFEPHRVLNVFDSIKKIIEPEINRNLAKWGGVRQKVVPYFETSRTQAEWEVNLNYYREFASKRPDVLRETLIDYFELRAPVNLKLNVNDKEGGSISLMGYKLKDENFEGTVFPDIPIRLQAIPNEGYEFEKWKGIDEDSECVISLKGNKKITAIFRKKE